LAHERKDVVDEFEAWSAKDLKAMNAALAGKKVGTVEPITRAAWDKAASESEGGGSGGGGQRRVVEFAWH
jgi:hypothetical protein